MNHFILPVLLTLICCSSEALFLRLRDRGRHWAAFFAKGLAALCFVGVGLLLSGPGNEPVVWGLCFGLLGDQLLALRKIFPARHSLFFISGALAFSLGHVCYMYALAGTAKSLFLPALPILAVLVVGSEVFARRAGFSEGKMHLPGLVYIGVEAAMCALALVRLCLSPGPAAALFAAGGVSFLVSDNLLCAYSFGRLRTPAVDVLLHAAYIAAQLLIAWSAALL